MLEVNLAGVDEGLIQRRSAARYAGKAEKSFDTPSMTRLPRALAAFQEIEADKNNELWVGELEGAVIATLQLTLIPGLSRGGMKRALLEGMRVHADHRSQGLGEQLMQATLERARVLGCGLIQLTTDTRRAAAHRFYVRMGFEPTHVGLKRKVESPGKP